MNLNEILKPFNIELNDEQIDKFEKYYELLIDWNNKINLTAITDYDEVIVKHFADSLIGLPYFVGRTCDVGAGAGFPSVPLAIAGVEDMLLLDSLEKRIKFLETLKCDLGLNYETIHSRAEDFGRGENRESFDTVTARAVANMSTLVEYLLPLVKVGGRAVVYKGGDIDEELKESEYAINILGGKINEVKKYTFESLSRSIVVVTKVKPTPKAYPRVGNKPKTSPLKKK